MNENRSYVSVPPIHTYATAFYRTRNAIILLLVLMAAGAATLNAQYSGPSILSRGGNNPGRRGRAPVEFTYYLATGIRYETGLLAPSLVGGSLAPVDDYGYTAEFGLYGGHDWRRSSLGVDYRGDYRRQSVQKLYNGTNHVIALDYTFRPSRRLQLAVRETGGTTNRAFGSFSGPAFSDTSRLGVPLTELFDVRTYFTQSSLYAQWQKSARVVILGGADAFVVKRSSFSLINMQGYNAVLEVRRRMTARDQAGLDYTYSRFEFPHVFAHSGAQTITALWERSFTRNIRAKMKGGVVVINSAGTETVTLSPAVAAALGRTTNQAAFDRSTTKPAFEARLEYTQQRGRFNVGAEGGIGAGNGIYLTTYRSTYNAGYSYTGIRRLSVGLNVGYTDISSEALKLPSSNSVQGGVGFSWQFAEHFNFTGQSDYRTYKSGATTGRSGAALYFGLAYSSSRLPLSIW